MAGEASRWHWVAEQGYCWEEHSRARCPAGAVPASASKGQETGAHPVPDLPWESRWSAWAMRSPRGCWLPVPWGTQHSHGTAPSSPSKTPQAPFVQKKGLPGNKSTPTPLLLRPVPTLEPTLQGIQDPPGAGGRPARPLLPQPGGEVWRCSRGAVTWRLAGLRPPWPGRGTGVAGGPCAGQEERGHSCTSGAGGGCSASQAPGQGRGDLGTSPGKGHAAKLPQSKQGPGAPTYLSGAGASPRGGVEGSKVLPWCPGGQGPVTVQPWGDNRGKAPSKQACILTGPSPEGNHRGSLWAGTET